MRPHFDRRSFLGWSALGRPPWRCRTGRPPTRTTGCSRRMTTRSSTAVASSSMSTAPRGMRCGRWSSGSTAARSSWAIAGASIAPARRPHRGRLRGRVHRLSPRARDEAAGHRGGRSGRLPLGPRAGAEAVPHRAGAARRDGGLRRGISHPDDGIPGRAASEGPRLVLGLRGRRRGLVQPARPVLPQQAPRPGGGGARRRGPRGHLGGPRQERSPEVLPLLPTAGALAQGSGRTRPRCRAEGVRSRSAPCAT